MDLEIELLTGELRLFKNTVMKLTSRFKRVERFLLSEFGSKFEQYEDLDTKGYREETASCKKHRNEHTSVLSNILDDEQNCSNSDTSSEAECLSDHVQISDKTDDELLGRSESRTNEKGEDINPSAITTTGKRKRGRPRKHPPQDAAKSDAKRSRPPFVKWILYKTFNDADEAEAYVLSEEQIWSKSFMNKSQQGKKQYFGCRVSRRCPARRALFYRKDGTFLLYKSEGGHDHSGVKASRLNRFANLLSYEEIEASISRSSPLPLPAEQADKSVMYQELQDIISNSIDLNLTKEPDLPDELIRPEDDNTTKITEDNIT